MLVDEFVGSEQAQFAPSGLHAHETCVQVTPLPTQNAIALRQQQKYLAEEESRCDLDGDETAKPGEGGDGRKEEKDEVDEHERHPDAQQGQEPAHPEILQFVGVAKRSIEKIAGGNFRGAADGPTSSRAQQPQAPLGYRGQSQVVAGDSFGEAQGRAKKSDELDQQ